MSIGFMVRTGQPLIWRGPMLHTAIKQFLTDVDWGELDYLIIDLPPGTGDAQLSLMQNLPLSGGVIVTMPQQVSLEDAGRGLQMFREMKVPVLGVVENMSYLAFRTVLKWISLEWAAEKNWPRKWMLRFLEAFLWKQEYGQVAILENQL